MIHQHSGWGATRLLRSSFRFIAFVIVFNLFAVLLPAQNKKFILTGKFEKDESGYPVQMRVLQGGYFDMDMTQHVDVFDKLQNGTFHLETTIDKLSYMMLQVYSGKGKTLVGDALGREDDFSTFFYLIEPGDSIHIDFSDDGSMSFSGKGYEKFQYRQELLKEINFFKSKWGNAEIPVTDPDVPAYFVYFDMLQAAGMKVLDAWKERLGKYIYTVLKGDIIGLAGARRNSLYYNSTFKLDPATKKYAPAPDSIKKYKPLYIRYESLPASGLDTLSQSSLYFNYLADRAGLDYVFYACLNYKSEEERKAHQQTDTYRLTGAPFIGDLKERLLGNYLFSQLSLYGVDSNADSLYKSYSTSNEQYKSHLQKKYNELTESEKLLTKGAPIAAVFLEDTAGNYVTLARKGKVVILDFWFTGCAPCKAMVPYMAKVKEAFKNNNDVIFINISVDEQKRTWIQNIKNYTAGGFNLYTQGKAKDHPFIRAYSIPGYPHLMIIGMDGKMYNGRAPRPESDNGKALIAMINEALKNS